GGIGLFHFDGDTIFMDYANEEFSLVHHLTREDALRYGGDKILCLVVEEDKPVVLRTCLKNLQQGSFGSGVLYRTTGSDGRIHWIEGKFRIAYKKNGILYCYGAFTNMDERKETEEKLKESQAKLQEAVINFDIQYSTYFPESHTVESYVLGDRNTDMPASWENYPDSYLSYVDASDEDARAYREMVAKIDRGDDKSSCVIQARLNGKNLFLRISMMAVRDSSGKTIKALVYSLDITARKNAEMRLRKEQVRLRSLEGDVVEAFTYNVTRNTQEMLENKGLFRYDDPISEDVKALVDRIAPPPLDGNPFTRGMLYAVAQQCVDERDRIAILENFNVGAIRKGCAEGRFGTTITCRRRVGDDVRWFTTNLEVLPDPDTGDFIAFFYTRDVNDEVLGKQLAQSLINRNYLWAGLYDVSTGKSYVRHGAAFQGMTYEEFISSCMGKTVAPLSEAMFRERSRIEIIRSALGKDGEYYFFYQGKTESEVGNGVRWLKGDAFYLDATKQNIVFLVSDVTEVFEQERKARDKLSFALKEAETANRAKIEFLSRISHDIRTPMNIITSKTDFAMSDIHDPRELERDLKDIKAASEFLLSLINDILDISKIDSNVIELHPEPYTLEEFEQLAFTMFMPMCRKKGVAFSLDRNTIEGIPRLDRIRFNQILLNLVSNAVKYTPSGGAVTISESILLQSDGKLKCSITVKDTGIGMGEEFQKHMFEPFTREDRQVWSPLFEQGTGLGLAIVKRLVTIMGGAISVESKLEKGTSIRVDFISDAVSDEEMVRYEKKRRVSCFNAGIHLKGTVLVAEDHPINAQITKRIMENAGMTVELAENGRLAVQRFLVSEPGTFSLILMDIQMPVMDGYQATREIRRLPRPDAKTVPIIAMTANAFAEDVKRCIEAGMNAHVPKPIDSELLFRTILDVLRH
ncbi:MAG: response regulator, partial [Sphaerochaetaceae bacterium]